MMPQTINQTIDKALVMTAAWNRRLARLAALLVLSGVALPLSAAKVYQFTNSAGETVFTDEPVAGAKVLEIQSAPVIPMKPVELPEPTSGNAPAGPTEETTDQPRPVAPPPTTPSTTLPPGSMPDEAAETSYSYDRLTIVEPVDGEVASRMRGSITIQLAIEPGLHSDDRVFILVDGEPRVRDSSGQRHLINGITPGVHELVAQIRRDGEVRIQSAPVRFTLVLPTQ